MKLTTQYVFLLIFSSLFFTTEVFAKPPSASRIEQELVPPPLLPQHDQNYKGQPRTIAVTLTIEEKEIEIDDGVYLQALTFNGSVPAPIIVATENDFVEVTLINPATNQMFHNIDFHAATGAMGGASITGINPGEKTILRFKATKPGVFVYHCAPGGRVTPFHVVAGMNGAILVLPRDGLRDAQNKKIDYDKAYYLGEQDFYLPKDDNGQFIRYANINEAMTPTIDLMQSLIPSHIVFNGRVGALTGNNALTAAVGEKVLFIHSQANRDSRPHIIGGHADLVWQGGSFSNQPLKDMETWFVPGGAAVAALYEFKQPGLYAYVNHNLIEAIQLGAAAHIQVSGSWNNELMQSVLPPTPIN
ncbi:copper-containing nitrite reductase [Aliikangiella sp. IMCC44359]|uniref:copper-containing nitrite reductase n=1 Tax=Aliikangiella sp. IMCC44359 TaxID=3459125 RepID=UPI00403A970E